jgi:uridylate kinase
MENGIPIHVFNFKTRGNLLRILNGEDIGTKIHG